MTHSILIVDDEATLAKNIARYLTRHGYGARSVLTAGDALTALADYRPDLVLLDYKLPDQDGVSLLRYIRKRDPDVKVMMMTGNGSVETAVEAMKEGAVDYLTKPLILAELKLHLDRIIGHERVEEALAYYKNKDADRSGLDKLIGDSDAMQAVKRRVRQLLDAERQLCDGQLPAVLITGETGTGKELVARALHYDGPRRDAAFVELNCACLPQDLLEAELFGFEPGAFTGAKKRKLGLMESAHEGTLFLDEIGDLDIALQAKLLKVIEEQRVRRLGGLRDREVDVRIIAATNQELDQKVESGAFRADLLFRLKVMHIDLPPLRHRHGDVLVLASEFLRQQGERYGKPGLRFSAAAERELCAHTWPGNVRELRNVVEHAVLLCPADKAITPDCLAIGPRRTHDRRKQGNGAATPRLQEVEVALLREALHKTAWNVTRAADLLGISRDTLRYRMQKNNLRRRS